jgi:hypothetical protein
VTTASTRQEQATRPPEPVALTFCCPKCERTSRVQVAPGDGIRCASCGWQRAASSGDFAQGKPARCLICGCNDLQHHRLRLLAARAGARHLDGFRARRRTALSLHAGRIGLLSLRRAARRQRDGRDARIFRFGGRRALSPGAAAAADALATFLVNPASPENAKLVPSLLLPLCGSLSPTRHGNNT